MDLNKTNADNRSIKVAADPQSADEESDNDVNVDGYSAPSNPNISDNLSTDSDDDDDHEHIVSVFIWTFFINPFIN